jgi:hypothetical protein
MFLASFVQGQLRKGYRQAADLVNQGDGSRMYRVGSWRVVAPAATNSAGEQMIKSDLHVGPEVDTHFRPGGGRGHQRLISSLERAVTEQKLAAYMPEPAVVASGLVVSTIPVNLYDLSCRLHTIEGPS